MAIQSVKRIAVERRHHASSPESGKSETLRINADKRGSEKIARRSFSSATSVPPCFKGFAATYSSDVGDDLDPPLCPFVSFVVKFLSVHLWQEFSHQFA
jgi:hypothetical protein